MSSKENGQKSKVDTVVQINTINEILLRYAHTLKLLININAIEYYK